MNTRDPLVHIVDDDEAIRDVLVRLLTSEGVGSRSHATATEFLAVCESSMRGCVLLDIEMPDMSGMDLQRTLVDRGIDIPIIFLTGHGDIPLSSQAFRTGALDFLEKPVDNERLLERVREALARDQEQWHQRYRRAQLKERFAKLTAREHEVLKLVTAGYTTKEVAKALDISNRTVDVYRTHIMEKTNAGSLADLVSMAMELEASV